MRPFGESKRCRCVIARRLASYEGGRIRRKAIVPTNGRQCAAAARWRCAQHALILRKNTEPDMKHWIWMLGIALFAWGCQNKAKTQMNEDIVGLEQAYEKQPSAANALPLLQQYEAFIAAYGDDKDLVPRYLYRMASIHYQQKNVQKTLSLLDSLLVTFEHPEATPRGLMLKANIMERAGQKTEALRAYSRVIATYPNHPEALVAQQQLPTEAMLQADIARIKQLQTDTSVGRLVNRSAYSQLANAYLQHVIVFPESDSAAQRLYSAGGLFMSVGDAQSAVEAWTQAVEDYPQAASSRNALIELAYCYENVVMDLDAAKKYYSLFVERYPNDEMTDDAQLSLDNLGKSPEELLKSIQSKGQEPQ